MFLLLYLLFQTFHCEYGKLLMAAQFLGKVRNITFARRIVLILSLSYFFLSLCLPIYLSNFILNKI